VPHFRLGAARTAPAHSGCSGGAVRGRPGRERRRLRGEPGGPEPAANGRSRALRLSQSEPAALPLSNERPGRAGPEQLLSNERPGAGPSGGEGGGASGDSLWL